MEIAENHQHGGSPFNSQRVSLQEQETRWGLNFDVLYPRKTPSGGSPRGENMGLHPLDMGHGRSLPCRGVLPFFTSVIPM